MPDVEEAQNTRITVALVPKAAADLADEVRASRNSKTDVVNRSVSLYRFVMDAIRDGDVLVIQHPDGSQDKVLLL